MSCPKKAAYAHVEMLQKKEQARAGALAHLARIKVRLLNITISKRDKNNSAANYKAKLAAQQRLAIVMKMRAQSQ